MLASTPVSRRSFLPCLLAVLLVETSAGSRDLQCWYLTPPPGPPSLSACMHNSPSHLQDPFHQLRYGLHRPLGTRALSRELPPSLEPLPHRMQPARWRFIHSLRWLQGGTRPAQCVDAAAGGEAVRSLLLSHAADMPAAGGSCGFRVCRCRLSLVAAMGHMHAPKPMLQSTVIL